MWKLLPMACACLLVLAVGSPAAAGEMTAQKAFDQLKGLEGTWTGEPEAEGVDAEAEAEMSGPAIHEIQVSAAGNVVMETMNPDTEHEMINMYHLDGEELLITHYCAGGTQPRMKLNRSESTAEILVFDFVGGTNMDAADHYIGSARIKIVDEAHIESIWNGYAGEELAGTMTFHLARAD